MPKENTTVYIILGLLNHEDLSGYDIKKKIDVMISGFWEVGYGQIYPTLAKLVAEELVVKHKGTGSKGPEKNIYSITDKGRELLKEWVMLPEQKEYTKYEILLKLFFGSLVPDESNLARIEDFKERHIQNLQLIQMFKGNLERVLHTDKDHLYFYLTVLFGEHVYKAYLDWADEAKALLAGKPGTEPNMERSNGDV
ncbi:PadR family transcriptional regulator [Paenibacillus jilunlii]|uniref:PadR family transcriptional regulator n=1 Tax=Paenibacillus jilunlii TaxID=682956 RepID=A0A1G9PHD0_9BACL|nr:PadR family transcriptional regulator [Paenibacillus jilunlii]KWX70667.1 PadR family transcriptional regulator [Paenibacillus jilunlii]SDL97881.1 transcriptional regulator, PadR family [Paenibacillus jilunlii]